jgi:lysozyme family protein
MSFELALKHLLESEGGYTSGLVGDSGGETNMGVTKRVWEEWVGHPVKTLKNLTEADVAPLYEKKYWQPNCSKLPDGLSFLVFSMGVNSGVGRATKIMQSCLGVSQDGIIGNQTLGMIKSYDTAKLIDQYTQARIDFYKSLNKPQFEKGWVNRATREKEIALTMIKH